MHLLLANNGNSLDATNAALLEQQGWCVTHVTGGEAALAAFCTAQPDLVVMDAVMQDMDGVETVRRIRALDRSHWTPVLLVGQHWHACGRTEALQAGADECLVSPVPSETLAARLRACTMPAQAASVLDHLDDAVLVFDEQDRIQMCNKAAERIFAYTGAEMLERHVADLLGAPWIDLRREDGRGTGRIEAGCFRQKNQMRGQRKHGEQFPIRMSVTALPQDTRRSYIAQISDISDHERQWAKIEFLALHDSLTGLPNRTNWNEVVQAVLAKGDTKPRALMFIDLDDFKRVNDQHGHATGDEALKIVATRLRNAMPASDFIARLGGDEFVALARNLSDENEVNGIAERLLDVLAQPMLLRGVTESIRASIGIVIVGNGAVDAGEMLAKADCAMYRAKDGGKGRIDIIGVHAGGASRQSHVD